MPTSGYLVTVLLLIMLLNADFVFYKLKTHAVYSNIVGQELYLGNLQLELAAEARPWQSNVRLCRVFDTSSTESSSAAFKLHRTASLNHTATVPTVHLLDNCNRTRSFQEKSKMLLTRDPCLWLLVIVRYPRKMAPLEGKKFSYKFSTTTVYFISNLLYASMKSSQFDKSYVTAYSQSNCFSLIMRQRKQLFWNHLYLKIYLNVAHLIHIINRFIFIKTHPTSHSTCVQWPMKNTTRNHP